MTATVFFSISPIKCRLQLLRRDFFGWGHARLLFG